jgi:hypothetical protein
LANSRARSTLGALDVNNPIEDDADLDDVDAIERGTVE